MTSFAVAFTSGYARDAIPRARRECLMKSSHFCSCCALAAASSEANPACCSVVSRSFDTPYFVRSLMRDSFRYSISRAAWKGVLVMRPGPSTTNPCPWASSEVFEPDEFRRSILRPRISEANPALRVSFSLEKTTANGSLKDVHARNTSGSGGVVYPYAKGSLLAELNTLIWVSRVR